MALSKYLHIFASIILLCVTTTFATVPLADLRYLTVTHEYSYVAPAMGALCQDYAKNLSLLGEQSSEAVIFLHELYEAQPDTVINITHKATAIGSYLDPQDIGTLIGIVVRYKNNMQDAHTTVKRINEQLKKVVIRKQCQIKKSITLELKKSINKDNSQYLKLEKSLLALASKKNHPDLEKALKAAARIKDTSTETAVANACTSEKQRSIWQEMKELHRSLQHDRDLLDTEQRTCEVSSPKLKDSMGAFTHALQGSIAEEETLYVQHNTIYLLLAFLYAKSQSKEELCDAYEAMALALAIDKHDLYNLTNDKPYAADDYKALLKKSFQEIAQLPLEDLIFARLGHTLYASEPSIDLSVYFHSILEQYQLAHNEQQKELLEILIAAWAPSEADVSALDQRIIYCRFLMQPAHTIAERIALVQNICTSNPTHPMLTDAYLCALANIYHSLPVTLEAQEKFFESIITCLLKSNLSPSLAQHIKTFCTKLIQHADNAVTKTAVLSVFMKHHLFDTHNTAGFNPFDQEHAPILYASTIESDWCKAKLIIIALASDINEKEFLEWVLATLPTIKEERAQGAIIKYLMRYNAPTDKASHPFVQQYYTWATITAETLKDEPNRTELVLAALTYSASYKLSKQSIALRTAVTTKLLQSIHSDKELARIMSHLTHARVSANPQLASLYSTAYDWMARQMPLLHDEDRIINLVECLFDILATNSVTNQELLNIMYVAIEKGLQSIHAEPKKIYAMQMILDRTINADSPHTKLYKSLYQWIEEQSKSIKNAAMREELLRNLLAANKNLPSIK
jgi:Ni,Fe-hydrogenase III component G